LVPIFNEPDVGIDLEIIVFTIKEGGTEVSSIGGSFSFIVGDPDYFNIIEVRY
jgi:hypothetical protein